jgi:acyl-coenzyme A thioesterase PaaI-like protein
VHGGFVIAAFDDLLGVAQAASGTAGFTGTLTVRLVARTPLHERIDYEAGVQERSGRKVTVWGRSTLNGELLAEATGIFIAPRGGMELPQEDG